MWCQARRHLCKQSFLWELPLRYLKSNDAAVYSLRRWFHKTSQFQTSKMQRIVIVKCSEKTGKKSLQVVPPASEVGIQSVVLPGPERIRASALMEKPEKLLEYPDAKTKTVYDVLSTGYLKTRIRLRKSRRAILNDQGSFFSQNGRCLGSRTPSKSPEYEWISYDDVVKRSKYVGSGLINLGLEASQKSYVGICTKTRPEFVLTLLGCSSYSMVLVPMYESLGPDVISFIISQAELKVMICEDLKIASLVLQNRNKYPHLKHIILIDDAEEIEEIKNTEVNVTSLKELEELGKSKLHEVKKPKPEDLFCICYTSGTTGQPKGVMITHRNVTSTLASLNVTLGEAVLKNGIIYAYLPCAHIYEIINEINTLYNGGQIGFYSGSTENILEDISYLHPTVLPLVPKVMNRIFSAVKKKVGPNILKRYIFNLALKQKEKNLKRGLISRDTIWDSLIFHDVQKLLGGRVEMIFTASAPVSKEVMKFFRCAAGCLVFEAYGLTEVGAATMTLLAEHDGGFVGPPMPSNHIKLVSVPELYYDEKDDVGEICIHGPNVFLGYFKNAEDTKKAMDSEGWHYTGDIGRWLPNGTLSIIDRKKHIFKLSQGEYIIPEKSENIYVQSHLISQCFVDGVLDQDYPVAIVVPDEPAFIKWAQEKGFKDLSYEELCNNKNVRKALLDHMIKCGKRKNLISLQQVGNVHMSAEPFSIENDLLTPTMKLKRPEARKRYEDAIKQLYSEGNWRKKCNL